MTLKLSTCLLNKMTGMQATPIAVTSNSISPAVALDYTMTVDTIGDASATLLTEGFAPGQLLYTYGSTTAGNDLSGVAITAVTELLITFASGNLAASEAFAATTFAVSCTGGSVKDIFHDSVLRIYSGSEIGRASCRERV